MFFCSAGQGGSSDCCSATSWNFGYTVFPKFNSEFSPENGGWKWLEDYFLLGFGNFSGANC